MAANKELAAYKAGQKAKSAGKHKKARFNISLAVVAGFMPYAGSVYGAYKNEGFSGASKIATKIVGYDGYTGKMGFRYLMDAGWPAILMGVFGHKLADKLGINRHVRRITGGYVSI